MKIQHRHVFQHTFLVTIVLMTILLTVPLTATYAFTFTKNTIITDAEAENSTYLSVEGIQAFLTEKGSVLARYHTTDIDGVVRSAAEIIHKASQQYSLNPLFFLVMGQKESGAITNAQLTHSIKDWWLGYGRCDGCSASTAAPYKGFTKQIYSAGNRIRHGYLHDLATVGHTVSGWGRGITKRTLDGIDVTPTNNITAALYTYNPYVGAYGGGDRRWGANSAFQKLWQEWYKPKYLYTYPTGSLLQIGNVVYLIKGKEKFPFTSRGALYANYDESQIISVPAIVGEQYKTSTPIQFPEYSLLQAPNGGVYLFAKGKKRPFVSLSAFRHYGFHTEEIISATTQELKVIPNGLPITETNADPRGVVVKDTTTKTLYYIGADGYKRAILSPTILQNRLPYYPIENRDSASLSKIKERGPLLLKDGTLITSKNSKAVYIIANQRKHAFKSKKVFDGYGYQWKNIITVSDFVLQLHKDGKMITLSKKEKKTTERRTNKTKK
ncbi:MAG TPA: hypothetical protein VJB65_02330 [Patescibacteria group bacterium]|nr:hypothetical protein [Patescibacteria group bacterium]